MIVLPRCSFYPAIEACETESRNRASCLVFYELLENRLSCENLLSDLPTSILCFARRECEQVYDIVGEEDGSKMDRMCSKGSEFILWLLFLE